MTSNTEAFFVGLLVGNILIPALLYRLRPGGRWDGWLDARRSSPSVGQFVLVFDPKRGMAGHTFGGDEHAHEASVLQSEIYWRPLPRPPVLFRRPQ